MLCLVVGVKESRSVPLRSNVFSLLFSMQTTAIIMPLHFLFKTPLVIIFCNNLGYNNKYNNLV